MLLFLIQYQKGTVDMTEEVIEKIKKHINDSFSHKTPTYTSEDIENAIRNMIINMLDQLENSNTTLQKP